MCCAPRISLELDPEDAEHLQEIKPGKKARIRDPRGHECKYQEIDK